MTARIRVLHLEDNRGDALLVRSILEAEGLDCQIEGVDTQEGFSAALEAGNFDVILSDYALPSFDGITALALTRARRPDIPFIFVSGTMGEELAIESLKSGATDYVLKDRATRLAPSIRRALAEARDRRASREATEALRKSEAQYRSIVETTNEWIWAGDLAGRITYSNQAAETISGYRPDELVGTEFFPLFHPEDLSGVRELLARCVGERSGFTGHVFRLRHKSGAYRHIEASGSPILDEAGVVQGFRGASRDITERMSLEAQLRQSQKMEAIGTLAGGVAHDFNNLLTTILGYSDLLLDQIAADSPLREDVNEIRKSADRAASLTRQLLAFSRRQVIEPAIVDLNAIVGDMDKMLRRLIGEDLEFSTVTRPDLGRVKVDRGQIEQVVMNLAVNARDAMPTGGRLTIETNNVDLDEEYAKTHIPTRPGPYVMLAVTDTGDGMDAETRSRIFEPFFTTKPLGKGTGLGLSTVYGIVKQSGGFIWVYSEPGHGTTFKIYFPRVEEEGEVEAEKASSLKPKKQKEPKGSETLLLVEDEEGVRKYARIVLERAGYHVLEAKDGSEAVAVAERFEGEIHLLLSDSVMPGLTVRELIARFGALRPETLLMLMSGYTNEAIARSGLIHAGIPFLQKPFTAQDLTGRVRDLLDARRR